MNVIDLAEPLDMVYRNTDARYWAQDQPWQMMPKAMRTKLGPACACVDPCLCVRPGTPAFYTAWGDPRWVRPLPNGGPIQTGTGEAYTPPGVGSTKAVTPTTVQTTPVGSAKTHYLMPQPMLPATPTGTVQRAGVAVEPIGGGMEAEIPMPDGWIAAGPMTIQTDQGRFRLNPLWLLGGAAVLLLLAR